jgi:hypothetical protein
MNKGGNVISDMNRKITLHETNKKKSYIIWNNLQYVCVRERDIVETQIFATPKLALSQLKT